MLFTLDIKNLNYLKSLELKTSYKLIKIIYVTKIRVIIDNFNNKQKTFFKLNR